MYLSLFLSLLYFNICLSYLLLLRIPFGVLLLSIARQLINMDHTVGLPRSLAVKAPATPQAPPRPGTPPHGQTASLFARLKNYTWNMEDATKERGRNRKKKEGDEMPGGRERTNKARNQ